MPNYDFKCQECHHKFSKFVSIAEKDKVVCPICQSSRISQLFTGFGIIKSNDNCGSGCGGFT